MDPLLKCLGVLRKLTIEMFTLGKSECDLHDDIMIRGALGEPSYLNTWQ